MGIICFLTLWSATSLQCWEEDPRIQEHNKLTDDLIALGDNAFQLERYKNLLEKRQQDEKTIDDEDDDEEFID